MMTERAEVNSDAMATAQLMGAATRRIKVGTWIANIYLRHSYVCAQGAALIADATDGRFVLGLGVSHQPVNQALDVDMPHPTLALRRYVTEVRSWLKGEGPATHLPQRPAVHHVPLYVAALASTAVELGGELADGVMPFLWPAARVTKSKAWVALVRVSGFEDEAALMEKGGGLASLTDRLLDSVCLFGSVSRCQEQLAAFRGARVDLPILVPPIGVEGAQAVINAFRR